MLRAPTWEKWYVPNVSIHADTRKYLTQCLTSFTWRLVRLTSKRSGLLRRISSSRSLIASAGGKLVGYNFSTAAPIHWARVTVNVNIEGSPGQPFNWGYLSTPPSNIRIFKVGTRGGDITKLLGWYMNRVQKSTCDEHPWDAMILRDCRPNTGTLNAISPISARRWDVLCMKMCEDYDRKFSSFHALPSLNRAGPNRTRSMGCHDNQWCWSCNRCALMSWYIDMWLRFRQLNECCLCPALQKQNHTICFSILLHI